jgi:hypothetical protein
VLLTHYKWHYHIKCYIICLVTLIYISAISELWTALVYFKFKWPSPNDDQWNGRPHHNKLLFLLLNYDKAAFVCVHIGLKWCLGDQSINILYEHLMLHQKHHNTNNFLHSPYVCEAIHCTSYSITESPLQHNISLRHFKNLCYWLE